MEMKDILLIVGDPRGILDQQLSHHPIHWLNIIIIKLNITPHNKIKLMTILWPVL